MTNSLPIVALLLGLTDPDVAAIQTNQKSAQLAQASEPADSAAGGAALLGASGGMDDAEAKCYAARYTDLNATVDPKAHWNTIGKAEGRLGACAKKLTQFEAQRYLNMNPELQKKFGRTGGEARNKANKHFMTEGYKDAKLVNSTRNEFTEPWFCGVGQYSNCQCQGVMYFGPTKRPDNGAEIKSFDDMRQWRTIAKETDNWTMCSAQDFGSDPWPNQEKQCWCEPKPQYEPSKCADEGEDCLCNGWVMFGIKQSLDDPSQDADFEEANQQPFTVNDANRTSSISCSASSFEDADPLPKGKKQCFCDEEKQLIDQDSVNQIKDYWRAQVAQQQMEIVYSTTSQVVSQAQDEQVSAESSASEKLNQQNEEDAKDEGTCSQCAIAKIESETKAKKKKIQQDKIEREKESARKHDEVVKKQTMSASKKTQAQTLRIQAESTTNIATKTILIEQAERLIEDSAKLDSDAEIENEKVIEEDQTAIKNEQAEIRESEKERIQMEREAVEKAKKEENRKKLRKAQIKQQQAIERRRIIEQKMQADRVRQKTAQQIEINMQKERLAVEKQILVEKRRQDKIKKNMMTTDGGDYSVQKQNEITVKYTTKKLKEERVRREGELKKQREKYEEVKKQQIIIIQQRQAEAHKHQVIRMEAQKAADEVRRRQQSIQNQIQVSTGMVTGGGSTSIGGSSSTTTRTTTSTTITQQQIIELQKELKAVETQIETNTKIAELEAKTENKALKEVEEANSFISHEAKMVTQAEDTVTNVTNSASEAEAAEAEFEENKEEDGKEEESVGEEILAFQKNATATEKETEVEEARQELNNRTTYYITYRRRWETNHQHFIQMREQTMKNITFRRSQIESSKNETEKIIWLKEIEQMEGEEKKMEEQDEEEKKEGEKIESEVKEVQKQVNEVEIVSKKAREEAKKEEELVQKTREQSIVIRRRALGKKQDKCKVGKKAFEDERDATDALKKAERKTIEDNAKAILEADMTISKQQGEIAKFASQKGLLVSRRQKETVQAELAKLDQDIKDLDAKARLAQQEIQAQGAKKASSVAIQSQSQDKISAQERKLRATEMNSKAMCQIAYSSEQKMTQYITSMNQTSDSESTTTVVTGSRGGSHRHRQQRRIVYRLQEQAVQRRRSYSRSWMVFKRTRTEFRTRIVYYQRQIDQYTITITNYRYMWDQHRTRIQELRNLIQTSQDSSLILKYKAEITKLKSDIDEYRKQIEVATAAKQKVVTQKRSSRQEIKKMRGQVEQLKKDAQEAEQTVTTTLSSQSGMAAKAERAQEQAEIKCSDYETKKAIVEEEKKAQKKQIAKKQTQIAEFEMNEKEAQEIIINLKRRKESIDTSAPDSSTIIGTIDAEIASETKVADEYRTKKEAVIKEITESRTKIEKDEAEVKKLFNECKNQEKSSQEISVVQETRVLKTQGEKIQKEASLKRLEQAKMRREEIEEEERTEELIEKDQIANYTKIQEEVKKEEQEEKEAEDVINKEETEVKEWQTKISRESTTKEQQILWKVEIEKRQRIIVEKRRYITIIEEKKAKNRLIEEAMKESIQEQEGEILAAKKEVEKVVVEAKNAETQISNTKTSQSVTSKKAVRKMEREERASRRRIEQLEKRIEENKKKEKKIVEEKAQIDKDLPAAEMEFRQQQSSVQRDEVSTLVTTCTRLITEKTELFDMTGLGFTKTGATVGGGTDAITSCLACGSGSTGVSQVLLPIASAQKAEEVAQILFSKALIADVEEVRSSRKASIVNGEIKVSTPEAQVRLLMTTSDSRLSELMQEIITWDPDAQQDIQVTPLKYGKSDYFDFVKQSTRVASAQTGVIRQRICSGGNCPG